MSVPVHDDLGPGKRGVQLLGRGMAQLVTVRHHDLEPIELGGGDLRQAGADLRRIGVAVHGRHRRDRLEVDQDLGLADVTSVQDVVHFLEHVEHFRTQQSVRVRDDAQSHFPSQRLTRLIASSRWSSTRCTTKSTRSDTF